MTRTIAKTKAGAKRRGPDESIDLERVVWDPDYRAQVRDRLNRAAPPRGRTGRKPR